MAAQGRRDAQSGGALTPVALFACACYAGTSTLVTLLNKVVFSHSRFHYPWTTLAVQNVLSVLLIVVGNVLGLTPAGVYSRKLARDMSVPIVCFVFFIFTNAQSMRHINIPVLTVWKSLGPMFVTLFERFYFNDVFSSHVYLAMCLIVMSALVTAINDLEYSVVGYLWAAANVLANVAYLASLRMYLRSPNISALDKTFHSNLLSLIPIGLLAVAAGEAPAVVADFYATDLNFKLVFLVSGFITTAVCATAFWTISLTNGSTLSFIGGLNKIPMILISLVVFETNMTFAGWTGVVLGIVAGIVFMRAKTGPDPAQSSGMGSKGSMASPVSVPLAPNAARVPDMALGESASAEVGGSVRHVNHHANGNGIAPSLSTPVQPTTGAPGASTAAAGAAPAQPVDKKLPQKFAWPGLNAVMNLARRNVGLTGVSASSGE